MKKLWFASVFTLSLALFQPGLLSADGYTFSIVAQLGTPAPGGTVLANDFEILGLDERGDVFFGTDINDSLGNPIGEALYFARGGVISRLIGLGDPVPGGGTVQLFWDGGSISSQGNVSAPIIYLDSAGNQLNAIYAKRSNSSIPVPIVVPNITLTPFGVPFLDTSVSTVSGVNSSGQLSFDGLFQTPFGIQVPGQPYAGVGVGAFRTDVGGGIQGVVVPGEAAPGGGSFDFAAASQINARGDVVIVGHEAGTPCGSTSGNFCVFNGTYLWRASTGAITAVARPGDPAPGGGIFLLTEYPLVNAGGDVIFNGLPDERLGIPNPRGLYRWSRGVLSAVALPGDPLPGGDSVLRISNSPGYYDLNDAGVATFHAHLNTGETGVYVALKGGALQLVARAGGAIADLGTVARVKFARINNSGQIATWLSMDDGRELLVVATPVN